MLSGQGIGKKKECFRQRRYFMQRQKNERVCLKECLSRWQIVEIIGAENVCVGEGKENRVS